MNIPYNHELKTIFEKLGVFHSINNTEQTINLLDRSQAITLIYLCIPETYQVNHLNYNDFNENISTAELFNLLKKDNYIFQHQHKINNIIENKY